MYVWLRPGGCSTSELNLSVVSESGLRWGGLSVAIGSLSKA